MLKGKLFSPVCLVAHSRPLKRNASLPPKKMTRSQYCMECVRKSDYEGYLAALLLPTDVRTSAFAIKAFNVEVSQIQDTVSEKQIGLMRVQYWREAIDQIYKGNPPKSPTALELEKAVRHHKLSKRWLQRLLDSREEQMHKSTTANLQEVEDYSENAVSSVNYLILEMLGVKNIQVDHAASHLGKAQGLTTLIRAVPHNAQRHRVHLPVDLMIKHNVSQEDVIRGCKEQKMKDLIFDIATQANYHLDMARSFKKDVPREALPMFFVSVPVHSFLRAIQYADFDIYNSQLFQRNNWLPLLMLKQKWMKTY